MRFVRNRPLRPQAVLARVCALAAVALGVGAQSALAFTPPEIYWANGGTSSIGVAKIDGTGSTGTPIINGANGPRQIAVDGQHVYWANSGGTTIGRAGLDGSNPDQSFITTAGNPTGVAVNDMHVYWTNPSAIGEANIDGSNPIQNFISLTSPPSALAVDGQHIYWTSGSSIGEANLDGTGVNKSLITVAGTANGVAVDGQHIYWTSTNSAINAIGEANLDGTDPNQSLIKLANNPPQGVTVDGRRIYWTIPATGTIEDALIDGTGVNQSFINAGPSNLPMGVGVWVPVLGVSGAQSFPGTTPQGTSSAPQTVTITNQGQTSLTITGLSFTGNDPGDFIVGSDTCLGSIAPGLSCQLAVSFSPQAQGKRSAMLAIASTDFANSPIQVALFGTGGSLPQGPTGPQGTAGPTGATGPSGAGGRVQMVTCFIATETVSKRVKGHLRRVKIKQRKCTTKLVSGPVRFRIGAGLLRASITRGRLIYALGSTRTSHGRTRLVFRALRPVSKGRYTLILERRSGRRWIVTTQPIAIA